MFYFSQEWWWWGVLSKKRLSFPFLNNILGALWEYFNIEFSLKPLGKVLSTQIRNPNDDICHTFSNKTLWKLLKSHFCKSQSMFQYLFVIHAHKWHFSYYVQHELHAQHAGLCLYAHWWAHQRAQGHFDTAGDWTTNLLTEKKKHTHSESTLKNKLP